MNSRPVACVAGRVAAAVGPARLQIMERSGIDLSDPALKNPILPGCVSPSIQAAGLHACADAGVFISAVRPVNVVLCTIGFFFFFFSRILF